jgi:hypothetical protein
VNFLSAVTEHNKRRWRTATRCVLLLSLACTVVASPVAAHFASISGEITSAQAHRYRHQGLNCGYDPNGAEDELIAHQLNRTRLSAYSGEEQQRVSINAQDQDDVALIEDDGSIVIPESKFHLKNRSVMFTPEGNGYRVSRSDIGFTDDVGWRLGYFLGPDGLLADDLDDGYRDIIISGALFPFYGAYYDTMYIGTNGYITFGSGDTTSRLSASALASYVPRIAPLWADLDVTDTGNIYYHRLPDRHVITWDHAGQPIYSGVSTFQAVLFDDGRIAFVYRKVKARAGLIGLSPGHLSQPAQPLDFSSPPSDPFNGAVFDTFSKQKRLDLPALAQAFYGTHADDFDTVYIWADFDFDNGLGVARSFNIRNDIKGIGLRLFDRGQLYGSPKRLATVIAMGNANDWPADPQVNTAGLNSAVAIVCHEQGHRWLAYVRFDADHDIKDDLLGRDLSHWSFFVDSRTSPDGQFSSLMEGNAWSDVGAGVFKTAEAEVNYFSPLDQYLMGLRRPEDVGPISYLVTDPQLTEILRAKSPVNSFSLSASRRTAFVNQITVREGERSPDSDNSPREIKAAFILLSEHGSSPSRGTISKVAGYRRALENYFWAATGRQASLSGSLQ